MMVKVCRYYATGAYGLSRGCYAKEGKHCEGRVVNLMMMIVASLRGHYAAGHGQT
jgi:hypothetical protein